MLIDISVWVVDRGPSVSGPEAPAFASENQVVEVLSACKLILRELEDIGASTRYRAAGRIERPEQALTIVRRLRAVAGVGKVEAKWWNERKANR